MKYLILLSSVVLLISTVTNADPFECKKGYAGACDPDPSSKTPTWLATYAFDIINTQQEKDYIKYDDPYYFLKRQLVWLLVSIGAGVALVRFDYHWWRKTAWPLGATSVILLVLVFVPGSGRGSAGAAGGCVWVPSVFNLRNCRNSRWSLGWHRGWRAWDDAAGT